MRLAAIDIGTVTTRLLVAEVEDGRVTEVARSTDITHLGQDLTRTGTLSGKAMERVGAVIERYARAIREYGVERYAAVATSATRDASNGDAFLGMLAERGVAVEAISGEREAQLTFLGATHELGSQSVLVDDIGGGSTELIAGDIGFGGGRRRSEVSAAMSIDIGSRRLTELLLASDPPTSEELGETRRSALEKVEPFFRVHPVCPDVLISVAGTATSLSAIRQGLHPYDPALVHGSVLSASDVTGLIESLAGMTLARRRRVVGLHPDRAEVIVAGAVILEAIMASAGMDSTLVSEHDILYGVLLQA